MEEVTWYLWHGCHKISEGCKNCYVYRMDSNYEKDSSVVTKTQSFNLPVKRTRQRDYKIPSGSVIYTCFTSDFFLEEADEWRVDAWKIIRERSDCMFCIFTKRIDRFYQSLPTDWNDGYENVTIGCTVENQRMADYRLPIFLKAPIKHKHIICAPLLENLEISEYLDPSVIEFVSVGGESGETARPCDFNWVMNIRNQCAEKGISFKFHQTGAKLVKDGKLYRILRKYQHSQAAKANIDLGKTNFIGWDNKDEQNQRIDNQI